MGFEIDVLPVGKESKSGDAIAVRYGNLFGHRSEQTVVVIDGGYTDNGEALVDHIQRYYLTNEVDLVVSTHLDQDHIKGLEVVLQKLSVRQLWMHLPWKHSIDVAMSRLQSFSTKEYSDYLQKSLTGASDLETIANRTGVPIIEPFAGLTSSDGCLTVVGPTIEYYEELLAQFGTTRTASLLTGILEKLRKAVTFVTETIWHETLGEDGETSPQNNSSVISLLRVDGYSMLFTGDAGIPALNQASTILQSVGVGPGAMRYVQVPHHGSRRNVSPSVLDQLLGPKGQTMQLGTAFVSVCVNGAPKHPSKKVLNAFNRRGYPVLATQGEAKCLRENAPDRDGWIPASPLPFFEEVEEEEALV